MSLNSKDDTAIQPKTGVLFESSWGSVGTVVIYTAFAWSQAEAARATMFELAEKHRVGFFDVSSEDGGVWFAASEGGHTRAPW
ncbi:MAG: hypothetical protein V3W41_14165 [Planctomycetota bacterium]